MIDVRHEALDARHDELRRNALTHQPVHRERGLTGTVPVTVADRVGLRLETGAEPRIITAGTVVAGGWVEIDRHAAPGPGDRAELSGAQHPRVARPRPA